MSNKLLILPVAVMLLSGCVGKANHPQCQSLKAGAAGSQFGAALTGRYVDQLKADMDERQYERCEEMFDLVQYQAQQQAQLQQQEQAQEKAQELERHRMIQEKLSSPEMQKELRSDSLKDLVSCAKGERGEKIPPDVLSMVEGMCKGEIDRRVDSGKVSRAKVDKMISQGT